MSIIKKIRVGPNGELVTVNACRCGADRFGAPYHADFCPKSASYANSLQVGGIHYQKAIQPWDYIIANDLGYLEGNIVKYVSRWRDKNGVEDLKKAAHYLQKLIEVYGNDHRSEEESDCPEGTGCCAHNDADPEVQGTQAARRSG